MIKTYKPTSEGLRTRKTLVRRVSKSRPVKSLTKPLKGPAGRSHGRISSRHRQRGSKKRIRIIDFKRNKFNISGKVAAIEYDPNRGANIALVNYADGEKRYILAPEGLEVGMQVVSGPEAEISPGNSLPLENIPLGTFVHNVEVNIGAGGILARGAGNAAQVLAKEGAYVNVKLPSGEVKKVLGKCYASIGSLSNPDLRNVQLGKAGRKRYLGYRPHVRGVAMANPKKDHPHAGKYSTTGIGRPAPLSPWGWKTRGVKSRKRVHTDYSIVKKREKKRR
ncbi:MAG: 50S ribosomal protein L2 [Patescibacteria group bacterium]|nr:MAG: 50S ribosomal protein L2 [Patescibacteria group bacterium]